MAGSVEDSITMAQLIYNNQMITVWSENGPRPPAFPGVAEGGLRRVFYMARGEKRNAMAGRALSARPHQEKAQRAERRGRTNANDNPHHPSDSHPSRRR